MMETKKIDDLHGNPKNPRTISKHDGAALAQSMAEFGDLSGIVFNVQTKQLVGGHQRISVLKKLMGGGAAQVQITQRFDEPTADGTVGIGYVIHDKKSYAYREVSWSYDRELAANIAANRIQGEFDLDLLAEANYLLHTQSPDLLPKTGQTDEEIARLLDAVGVGGSEPNVDEAPALDEANPAVSQAGEIYQLGRHRLMCGSSTDFGQTTDLFDGQEMALVLTDPPYGIDIVQDNGKVGAGNLAENRVYEKVAGDGGIETARDFYATLETLNIKKSIIFGGNYFLSFLPFSDGWLIWDKRVDMTSNNFADGEMAWCSFHTPVRIYKQLWNGMIREGEKEDRVHPTQKPVKMLSEILADFSDREANVYDGFGGSGSTLIACEQMGRSCYMMELSPAYCDVIRKRWAKQTGKEAEWQTATPVVQTTDASPSPTP